LKATGLLSSEHESIMISEWPKSRKSWIDLGAVKIAEMKYELARVGRNLRAEYQIKPAQEVYFAIKPADLAAQNLIQSLSLDVKRLLKASSLEVDMNFHTDKPMPSGLCGVGTIYMDLEGVFDFQQEETRLAKQLDQIIADLGRVEGRLSNQAFVEKAPSDVVEREKQKKEQLLQQQEKIVKNLESVRSQISSRKA
jgi:valyl-tRNA synthetase